MRSPGPHGNARLWSGRGTARSQGGPEDGFIVGLENALERVVEASPLPKPDGVRAPERVGVDQPAGRCQAAISN